ncbi:MAG: discoidin domain-containing protein [Phycisphaerales bacterium]|jgi:hypothetical protein
MYRKLVFLISLILLLNAVSNVQAESFSLLPTYDTHVSNDGTEGPNTNNETQSGMHARDIASRRRVGYVAYDISEVKSRGFAFSNISFSNYGHDTGEVNVYGVLEAYEDLVGPGMTWNTAPGVQNNPPPALDTAVVLDLADVTDILLTFNAPARGTRESTDTSEALADFLNSDTNGFVAFMFAPPEGGSVIVRTVDMGADGGTLLEGDIGGMPRVALDPVPATEMTDVSRDIILSWKAGGYADSHDVYLGTVFEDVNDATRDNPLGVLVSQGQDANTYEPEGHLELGQTYYWRIDEVNAPPDSTIDKGFIWQFTVEPLAYAISGDNITATASSSEAENGPESTIDGSGLDDSGLLHTHVSVGNMWLSSQDGEQPTWIEYELDKVYKLHQMWVWNSNDSLEPSIGFGFRDVTVEYSLDGIDYMTLGTTHEFAQAPGAADYEHNTTVELNGIATKYIKLTANNNWGGILNQYGLSEVRFFYIPVNSSNPVPGSETTGVALDATLSWRAGREAVEHNVYFSDDQQAVIDGTVDVVTVTDLSHGPLSLDLGKTYYWRVDEVNNAETTSIWQGGVWSFTTHEYFVVDDFEDYNDYEPDRIFDAWVDGYGITTNGSTVGYPDPIFADGEHFVETTIVNSGNQSMPYFYDNTTTGNSEATMTLSSRRNWTEKGASTLTLWLRGNAKGFMEEPAGTYTIAASGADIWGTADEFRYVFKQLSGPGSIIARVESLEDTDPWAKAGVMIRQNLDPDSKFAAVYITPGNGCRFHARLTPGGEATSDTDIATPEQTAITAPYWVKIDRDASDNFNGYYSSDGISWTPMAWNPQSTAMPTNVYIGLALTSHNSTATNMAVFSNVQTTGTVSPQIWSQQAIGVEMPSNDPEPMYVALNNSAVVYHDNPNASLISEWTEWNINLQEFADQGINLMDVDKITIGFGDRDNPQLGGSGLVYFDDIRLYPQRSE